MERRGKIITKPPFNMPRKPTAGAIAASCCYWSLAIQARVACKVQYGWPIYYIKVCYSLKSMSDGEGMLHRGIIIFLIFITLFKFAVNYYMCVVFYILYLQKIFFFNFFFLKNWSQTFPVFLENFTKAWSASYSFKFFKRVI